MALDGVQRVYRSGKRRALLVAPTGSGKSAMTRYMLERTRKRTMILCHRGELRDMICEAMSVPYGVIDDSRRAPPESVHIGMMQTVTRRLDILPAYDWVISDEAHLAMCATWRRILQHYSRAWHLGLSATPCRLDGLGLGAEYEEIVHGPSIRELTERGYLVPCRVFAPPGPQLAIKKNGSEYNMADAAAQLNQHSITGDVIAHWQRLAPGRLTLVFCCDRIHAENVAREFRDAGIPAANVDGSMTDDQRKRRIRDFREGRIRVLTNVDLLTTGFDCPQIEAGIFLRPTISLALYMQMLGRLLRINFGKTEAILLDHVGNCLEHGLPDQDREWTLDGRAKRATSVQVVQCPECYLCHRPAPRCPSCGHVYATAAMPRAIKRVDGTLVEVDAARIEALRTTKLAILLKTARTEEALREIARARGFHSRWVTRVLRSRGQHADRAA